MPVFFRNTKKITPLIFLILKQKAAIVSRFSHIQYVDIVSKKRYPVNPQ